MSETKRVLLLEVSCKKGGLCPGGIDLDNPSQWIRIVRDDGEAGSVSGKQIDDARPLDIIAFEGHPVPLGIQVENWAIDNYSCRKISSVSASELYKIYDGYGYHGFWGSNSPYLTEDDYDYLKENDTPSESIIKANSICIYKNNNGKCKINFRCDGVSFDGISMTDPDFYPDLDETEEIYINSAIIVVSIPAEADFVPYGSITGRGYKFVSKIFRTD